MKSHKNPLSGLAAAVTSVLLLAACGQTGELYMPETYSTKPPPPPREPRMKKKPQQTPQGDSTNNTEKTNEGN
jgi:predicted small lipoprotein YifL